jgi:hypothetical protein
MDIDDEKHSLEEVEEMLTYYLRDINEQLMAEGYPLYDTEDVLGETAQSFLDVHPDVEPLFDFLRRKGLPESYIRILVENALDVIEYDQDNLVVYVPRLREQKCECSICYSVATNTRNKNSGYNMTFLHPCGHCFHLRCISKWVEEKTTCPNCRREILGYTVVYRSAESF